jgi:hypothetical protein
MPIDVRCSLCGQDYQIGMSPDSFICCAAPDCAGQSQCGSRYCGRHQPKHGNPKYCQRCGLKLPVPIKKEGRA